MNNNEIPFDEKEALLHRVKAESEQLCPACHQVLWTSFYFDGFGFSDKDGPRTNIVKLFDASIEDIEKGIRRYYYPGLGTEFHPETAALAKAVGARVLQDSKGNIADAAKGKAKEEVKKSVKDSLRQGGTVLGGVKNLLAESHDGLQKAVHKITEHPQHFAERQIRRLRREWKSYWRSVQRHPWRAAKEGGKKVAGYTAGAAAESIGSVRDASLIAALFNTGSSSRLRAAEQDFTEAVSTAQELGRVEHINVAIFGYDMGGGLALAFCQRLLTEICPNGRYHGIKVRIRFMGLFDCVTNRYDDNLLTGFLPLSNEVSSSLYLPKEVEYCVHYAAAHELRFYKPLAFIGADPYEFKGDRQEQLFPGSQQDVGGGADPAEDGISEQLARYPLQHMYQRAYRAGIPMPNLQQLKIKRPDLHEQIKITPEAEKFQISYRAIVKKLSATEKIIEPSLLNALKYSRMTGTQASSCSLLPPEPYTITELPASVKEQYKGHIAAYIQWLRIWYEKNADTAASSNWLGKADAPAAAGRYQRLAAELKHLSRQLPVGSQFNLDQAKKQIDGQVAASMFLNDPEGQALYWIWQSTQQRSPEVEALYPGFVQYMHDSMAESAMDAAYGDLLFAKHYLNRRPMQLLNTKPAPDFLESAYNGYKKLFGIAEK